MAKIQNPSIFDPRFEEFTIPSFYDCVDGDQDKMVLSPVKALTPIDVGDMFVAICNKNPLNIHIALVFSSFSIQCTLLSIKKQ